MNDLLLKYLKGEWKPPGGSGRGGTLTILVASFVPLTFSKVWYDGSLDYPIDLPPYPISKKGPQDQPFNMDDMPRVTINDWASFDYCMIRGPGGSLVALFSPVSPSDTSTDWQTFAFSSGPYICMPGDVGPVPTPHAGIPIPNDSPPILVGASLMQQPGTSTPCCYVVRTQFWKRSGDSVSVAQGETLTTGYTSTSGVQQSSSSAETVAQSVSASSAASWGPLSASISASLSTTSSFSQQYVATTTDTRFETREYKGPQAGVTTIFRWQLYDVVTMYSVATSEVLSQITTAQQPEVLQVFQSAELDNLPPHPLTLAQNESLDGSSAMPRGVRPALADPDEARQ
jgi:hypothetical protein